MTVQIAFPVFLICYITGSVTRYDRLQLSQL